MEVEHNYSSDAAHYFTENEWREICDNEKLAIQNTLTIFIDMFSIGFIMEKPEFMKNYEERLKKQNNSTEVGSEQNISLIRSEKKENFNLNNETETLITTYRNRKTAESTHCKEEELDDCSFIYCDTSMDEFEDDCKKNPLIHVKDNSVPLSPSNPNRARMTIPSRFLKIKKSSIPNAGEGVWSITKLCIGLIFGPFEGTSTSLINNEGCFSWQIKKNGKLAKFIDGHNEAISNWMRYVNCARNNSEHNLMTFIYHGQLYFRTAREIPENTEIFVYYGNEFAKQLGIDVKLFNSVSKNEDTFHYCTNYKLAFSTKDFLGRHLKKFIIYENNGHYKCNLCDNIYTNQKCLGSHLQQIHNIYEEITTPSLNSDSDYNSVNEETSEEVFRASSNLQLRKKMHVGARSYACNTCNKVFKVSSSLIRHKRIHSGKGLCTCNICDKVFLTLSTLTKHKRMHSGDRPYICNVCDKAFTVSSNLVIHKRLHSGERPYKCGICDKAFIVSSALVRHKRTHSGERPYVCDLCNKAFSESSKLIRHKKIHFRERSYTCKICDRTFTKSGNLVKHNRTHSIERS